ncbi:MAG: MaoC family dehydratase [Planctomycetes bacterium]|nr:MaoC family dehydratase [Planctomycetota bacterium]
MQPPVGLGETHESSHTFTPDSVRMFANLCGDTNPIHLDADFAAQSVFGRRIVHGAFVASLISRALGCGMPGSGTIYMGQQLRFLAPVFVDDTVNVHLEVVEVKSKGNLRIKTNVSRADGTLVVEGEAFVKTPRNRATQQ